MATTKKEALRKAAQTLFGERGYPESPFKKSSERAGVAPGLSTRRCGEERKPPPVVGLDVLEKFFAASQDACGRFASWASAPCDACE